MTADVNVIEKVARALYVRTARDNATHDEAVVPWGELHPYQQDRWLSYAADALAALADPEVLAGIAGVLREHGAPTEAFPDGEFDCCAAAVADWLTGGAR